MQIKSELDTLRLLQLSSATLPVGAFSFSQGLEYAIDQQWLNSVEDIHNWLEVSLLESMAYLDVPVLLRMKRAKKNNDPQNFFYWSDYLLASRESSELFMAEKNMGVAMFRLLKNLDLNIKDFVPDTPSFLSAYVLACSQWELSDDQSMQGYLWSWLENQVSAASKLLPMGQTQAQKMLLGISDKIPKVMEIANTLEDDDIGSSLPKMAMASAWHETQYSRLFRS